MPLVSRQVAVLVIGQWVGRGQVACDQIVLVELVGGIGQLLGGCLILVGVASDALVLPEGVADIDDPGALSTIQSLFEDRAGVNFQGTVTLEELAEAAEGGRLKDLPGLGAKSEARIITGISISTDLSVSLLLRKDFSAALRLRISSSSCSSISPSLFSNSRFSRSIMYFL